MTRPLRPSNHLPSYPTLNEPRRFVTLALGAVLVMGTAYVAQVQAQDQVPCPGEDPMLTSVVQRYPAEGSRVLYLRDGSYAGVTIELQADDDDAMYELILKPELLDDAIDGVLASESCHTLTNPEVGARLLDAINRSIPNARATHVSVIVAFCEPFGDIEGEMVAPGF